ncbi:Sodium/calcium exchanger [Echinococcus granulosus]|uniref:Sodium/calcium exchanger n=1 Tax=Echinococcus granulosus TaxID=6210 RepID=W6V4G9_ECHGR|nr:Sodium/calcium exchanger [Echinococcus granulosus]EUB61034.1 Sodium/calcium exchanger [Echinococcus granulosus]
MELFRKESIFFTLAFCTWAVNGLAVDEDGKCPSTANISCKDGLLLPVWKPKDSTSVARIAGRAIVYFLSLMYCFLGVSIIADRFMAAIEVITSQEKEVRVKSKSGEVQVISVRIWNETVSNLTLMALGSSAPEILLSIIEICGTNFEAGELGPGTIVGSAAFNLFVIIGTCIAVIPNGETRRIKHFGVFVVTSIWSVFAYLWLYFIISVTSKGIVEFWEAFLTFLFFPITVITAYIADIKLFQKKFLKKRYKARRKAKYMIKNASDIEANGKFTNSEPVSESSEGSLEEEYEKTRLEYIETIKEIRKKNPQIDPKALEELAQIEVLNKGPKSRAYYRIQATRQLTGSGNVITKSKLERKLPIQQTEVTELYAPDVQQLYFNPGHYTVIENVGSFQITISRKGGDLRDEVAIDYATEDGTAVANEDYEPTNGTLVFRSNEQHKQISITIIDDDVFEEDEHFDVRLSNLRVIHTSGLTSEWKLVNPVVATVMVLDDDHSGVFHFASESVDISESCEVAEFTVVRSSGARGCVHVPFKTVDGSAKGNGKDYSDTSGFVEFLNDQTEGVIRVPIVDDNDYEKSEYFFIELGQPTLVEKEGVSPEPGIERQISSLRHTELRLWYTRKIWKTQFSREYLTHKEQGAHSFFSMMSEKLFPDTLKRRSLVRKIDSTKTGEVTDTEGLDPGLPRLGQYTRLRVNIKESTELKNTVDRLVKHGKWVLLLGTSSWKEQFVDAITVNAGDDDDLEAIAEGEKKMPSCTDYVMHFLTVFWKVLFAFVPPTEYAGGWVCFVVSIIVIGFLTAIIGDLASAFGCTVGLTDAVTSTTFVALGTSLPDTFASKVAAIGDKYADSSICNVTGSNAVNVFLGIGVAWTIAAIVHWVRGSTFVVPAGSLGFSVTIFCIFALFAIALLVLRRKPSLGGGELGGPRASIKWASAIFFLLLWLIYVLLSSLENYCYIVGF